MSIKTRKPDLQAQFEDAEPVQSQRWRNVVFTKTSKTIYGQQTHKTKKLASDTVNATLAEALVKLKTGKVAYSDICLEDYPVTIMQIPANNEKQQIPKESVAKRESE